MTNAAEELAAPTGVSVGLGDKVSSPTRTIADLVNEAGHLKNSTRVLVADFDEIHQSSSSFHAASLAQLHRALSNERAKESISRLLDELSGLGFSWRDIARVSGVSVPGVRKWRTGGPASGENRKRVAMVAAICELARDQYLIDDIASWMETPLHPDAPVTVLDLLTRQRFDLVLELASDYGTDPELVLDQFEPGWRERYASAVEVFVAPDGLLGVRMLESGH